MAKKVTAKSKKNLKTWKKGQSGNKKGRPKLLPDELGQKAITNARLLTILNKFLFLDILELKKLLKKDKGITALEYIIGKIVYEAMRKGDDRRLQFLLERSLGKTPDKLIVEEVGHKSIVDAITNDTTD